VIVNIVLFIATIFTTLIAGALQAGVANPLGSFPSLMKGWPFAFSLMAILLSHEMGHFFMSRRHNVDSTLPYFIPGPPPIIGTFGAIIKMRSPIWDKRALLDIGAAGPLAGLVITIPILIYGLSISDVKIVPSSTEGIFFGDSLLSSLIVKLKFGVLPKGHEVFLNPVAFAGWIGLLITSMNLLPIGQLDGGHIAYAVFGRHQKKVSGVILIGLIAAGIMWWEGWLLWAALSVLFGLRHPPPAYPMIPLSRGRKLIGVLCMIVFIVTFIPVPVSFP